VPDELNLTRCDEGDHFVRGKVRAVTLKAYDYEHETWKSRTTTVCEPCLVKLRKDDKAADPR